MCSLHRQKRSFVVGNLKGAEDQIVKKKKTIHTVFLPKRAKGTRRALGVLDKVAVSGEKHERKKNEDVTHGRFLNQSKE